MSLQAFHKKFGFKIDIDNEKNKFIQRINQSIFYKIKGVYGNGYEDIFVEICYQLGINGRKWIDDVKSNNYGDAWIPDLEEINNNNFTKTLEVLISLYDVSEIAEIKKFISSNIEKALSQSSADLGIRWKDGMFYPAGAKEFDEILINDNLSWLEKYPKTREIFSTALSHFSDSISNPSARKDAITNAYSALESLSRILLNNKINFDKNSDTIVEKLNLPKEYKNIIFYYKQIANEYSSRHAGTEFGHEETEAFIYLTGILIRLIINKIS